ncbi:MAG: FtsX-like permease family protein [Pseudomonadota bacterium]
MTLSLKLAFKNIYGARLRSFLNVLALSFSFVVIIWGQGMYEGMSTQIKTAMIDTEVGAGQYWSVKYDPFDPFSIKDSHTKLSPELTDLIKQKNATPILIAPASIFPDGRIQAAILKGIDLEQDIINFPIKELKDNYKKDELLMIPGIIGTRMSKTTNLKVGDIVTARFRDKNDVFDAIDIEIIHIMKTIVPSMDNGQIWLPLFSLQKILNMEGEATIAILKKDYVTSFMDHGNFIYKSQAFLLKEITKMVKQKQIGGTIMYSLFLIMALLAIFDTQVLSIFRRRKEIGTLMALGMTRFGVIKLFTLEGVMFGIFAWVFGAIYGIPLLILTSVKGIPMPEGTDNFGIALGSALYPTYSLALILTTTSILSMTVIIVSYLPTRKISKMEPTNALRGNY